MEYMQDSIGGIWAYMVVMMVLFFISKKDRQKRRQENRESEGPRGESSQIEGLEKEDRKGRKEREEEIRGRGAENRRWRKRCYRCLSDEHLIGRCPVRPEELRKEKQDGEECWKTIVKLNEEIRFRNKVEEDLWGKIGELCEEIRNLHQEIARIDRKECLRGSVFPVGDSRQKNRDGGGKMEEILKGIRKRRGLKKPRALRVMEAESAKE